MCSKFNKLMHSFQQKEIGLTQISLAITAQGYENYQHLKRSKKWVSFKISEITQDLDFSSLECDLNSIFKFLYEALTEDIYDLDIITLRISCPKLFDDDKSNEIYMKPDLKQKNNFKRLRKLIEDTSFHCANNVSIRMEVWNTPSPYRPIPEKCICVKI